MLLQVRLTGMEDYTKMDIKVCRTTTQDNSQNKALKCGTQLNMIPYTGIVHNAICFSAVHFNTVQLQVPPSVSP